MNKEIRAIDMHTHINHGSKFDSSPDSLIYDATLDYLIRMNEEAKIDKMFCSTFSAVLSTEEIEAENQYMYELSQKHDSLYQWVVIDPRFESTFLQAEEMLSSKKCVGIKLHPDYHGYSILDYGDKVFSFAAQRDAVVLMHPQYPICDVVRFADKYPKTKIIVAHLGGQQHVDAIAGAKFGNIYTDTSGRASTNNHLLEYAVERIGSEKILFGTDTYAAGFQRGRIEYALISDADKENILRYNAERLFENII